VTVKAIKKWCISDEMDGTEDEEETGSVSSKPETAGNEYEM
jgi:hypothetical protein